MAYRACNHGELHSSLVQLTRLDLLIPPLLDGPRSSQRRILGKQPDLPIVGGRGDIVSVTFTRGDDGVGPYGCSWVRDRLDYIGRCNVSLPIFRAYKRLDTGGKQLTRPNAHGAVFAGRYCA